MPSNFDISKVLYELKDSKGLQPIKLQDRKQITTCTCAFAFFEFFSFLVSIKKFSLDMGNCTKDQSISFSDSEDEVGRVRRNISLELWIRF